MRPFRRNHAILECNHTRVISYRCNYDRDAENVCLGVPVFNISEPGMGTCSGVFVLTICVRWNHQSVLMIIRTATLPTCEYFMAFILDLRHFGQNGLKLLTSHRISRVRKHICRYKNRVSKLIIGRYMIMCGTQFNMG